MACGRDDLVRLAPGPQVPLDLVQWRILAHRLFLQQRHATLSWDRGQQIASLHTVVHPGVRDMPICVDQALEAEQLSFGSMTEPLEAAELVEQAVTDAEPSPRKHLRRQNQAYEPLPLFVAGTLAR